MEKVRLKKRGLVIFVYVLFDFLLNVFSHQRYQRDQRDQRERERETKKRICEKTTTKGEGEGGGECDRINGRSLVLLCLCVVCGEKGRDEIFSQKIKKKEKKQNK